MVLALLVGVPVKKMSSVEATTPLSNPRRDSNGVVTWDCVYFGNYPQSDATGQTKEPIKWRVLSVDGNDAFLVADQNLDVQRYNNIPSTVTWESCTMRSWLNGYDSTKNSCGVDYSNDSFIDTAFSECEQDAIMITEVLNPDNLEYGVAGGNTTQDKIFLLSYEEIKNTDYGFAADYNEDKARQRMNTAYVAAGGTIGAEWLFSEGEYDYWWLRSPSDVSHYAMSVSKTGFVYTVNIADEKFQYNYQAVCPVLHLDLTDTSIWSYAGTVGTAEKDTEVPEEENKEDETSSQACNHVYDDGVVTKKATYTEKGIKTYTCINCGEIKTEDISMLPIIKVSQIKLSGDLKEVAAGKKVNLVATILPTDATNQNLKWTTSNKKYATVSSKGVVTTKKKGASKTVTIKAATKDGSNIVATYKIKIVKHAVKSIKLKAKSKTVKAGKKLTLKAIIKTTGKTANKKLIWTSSNTKYATVTQKGVVKAKKAGKGKKVIITAMAMDGTGKKATFKINIK